MFHSIHKKSVDTVDSSDTVVLTEILSFLLEVKEREVPFLMNYSCGTNTKIFRVLTTYGISNSILCKIISVLNYTVLFTIKTDRKWLCPQQVLYASERWIFFLGCDVTHCHCSRFQLSLLLRCHVFTEFGELKHKGRFVKTDYLNRKWKGCCFYALFSNIVYYFENNKVY